uniref:E3 ubiquitin-protein ligase RNF182 n=1 Tax=Paramormyrops kingsleyae TaxID=1676925 RepID=A0A3B3RW40_9TELE
PIQPSGHFSLPYAVGDELECKICCQRYDTQSRRPKVLPCRHRLCARCFSSILGMGGTPQCLRCPFCRHDTDITLCQVAGLPDDSNIIAQLANTEKCWPSDCGGVVSPPQGLSSSLVEQDAPSQLCRHMPRILVWLLGFLYFGRCCWHPILLC